MKILIGSWFTLPRLGRDAFATLMEQGVVYDGALGFRVDAATDVASAVATIGLAIGEKVELSVRCFIDGVEACPGCPYIDFCDRTRVSPLCLCAKHSPENDVYGLYQKTFVESIS